MKSAAPGESSGGVGSAVGAIGSQRLHLILDLTEAGGGVSGERFLFTSDSLNGTWKTITLKWDTVLSLYGYQLPSYSM